MSWNNSSSGGSENCWSWNKKESSSSSSNQSSSWGINGENSSGSGYNGSSWSNSGSSWGGNSSSKSGSNSSNCTTIFSGISRSDRSSSGQPKEKQQRYEPPRYDTSDTKTREKTPPRPARFYDEMKVREMTTGGMPLYPTQCPKFHVFSIDDDRRKKK